jgi:arginyl-tRNA synthetase
LQTIVKQTIEKILKRGVVLEKPKDVSFGHFATPLAFSLAKEYKKSPKIIAQDLASKFKDCELFEEVTAVNGYLNFKLSVKFLDDLCTKAIKDEQSFAKANKNQKILLEYVSANPTGPLHIGHARGAILGDTLARIGKHLGYKITTEYYVNDAGSQIELLGLSLYLAGREFVLGIDVEYPQQYYRGEYLIDLANLAAQKFGKEIFEDALSLDLLADFAKQEVIELIKSDLFKLGIIFDNFVSEKSFYKDWDSVKKLLQDNGHLYQQDNKLWINSSEAGDEKDRVVVRDNGEPTYLAGDIIYHNNKFQRDYDKYINIWGADHHGYIPRVKASIKFLGYDESKLEVILSQMVSLLKGGEPYKMSKRAGNVILMSDVIEDIGSDALRFIFLTKKSDTHLEFDIDMLKHSDSSNPIFYINYAHARVNQLFTKANLTQKDIVDVNITTTNQDLKDLLYEALLLPNILQEVFIKYDCQKLTEYLYQLASLFHKFYNNYKIIDTDEQEQYLKVLSMVALSIRVGLKLLGIAAKEKM